MKMGTLSQEQSEYPATLTPWLDKDAPVQLSYIGNIEILKQPLLGLFSSVKCPANLIIKAHDLAHKLAESGTPVISGFHSPVEKEMLSVFLQGTGSIAICLARGLEEMRIPSVWREPIERGRVVLISLSDGQVKRPTVANAEKRNHLVAELAQNILIIHTTKGGRLASQVEKWERAGKKVQILGGAL